MKEILSFLREERLYILILIFILIFNALIFLQGESKSKGKDKKASFPITIDTSTGLSINPERSRRVDSEKAKKSELEEKLRKDERLLILFSLSSLLILAIALLGIVIDMVLSSMMLTGKFAIRSLNPPPAQWNLWDVCKVVILFMFFGYIIILSEASLARVFHILKADNFRMIVNSSILDTLAVVFIVYFAVIQYKEDIKALGVSFKNFLKNVLYGVIGYIALTPILIFTLIITAIIINITKYVPERQPVVELFLKEKDVVFLAYSSLFAAITGPIIEELFFRGFMYSALKKYIGVFWSIILTAAIFAALHAHIVGFVPIMALGVLLAYLYEKTGTLVSSVTVHMVHNLSMVFLVFLVKETGVI